MTKTEQIHATCVDVDGYGVVLMGPPGSGKSDLAFRLIADKRNKLVADDRTDLSVRNGLLRAAPPAALAGKLEVRGLGIVPTEYIPETCVRLAIELVARDAVERLPDPHTVKWMGLSIPLLHLHAFDASSPAKVQLAAQQAGEGILGLQ